jgi:hypothetical protein
LGGGGGLEDEGDEGVDATESPDVLRNPTGFLGGGGADLVLVVEADDRRCFSVSVCESVFTRRRTGALLDSSSEERSIRFGIAAAE